MTTYRRIGQLLLGKGLIDQGQLDRALDAQSRSKLRLGEVLVVLGYAEEDAITRCLSEQFDLPVADLSAIRPSHEALATVSSMYALTHLFLPVERGDGVLAAVLADPIDIDTTDSLIRKTGLRLVLSLAPPGALAEAITKCYGLPTTTGKAVEPNSKPIRKRRGPAMDDQSDRRALLESLDSLSSPPAA